MSRRPVWLKLFATHFAAFAGGFAIASAPMALMLYGAMVALSDEAAMRANSAHRQLLREVARQPITPQDCLIASHEATCLIQHRGQRHLGHLNTQRKAP